MTFPFWRIQTQRPYPPTGLTTARWMSEVATRLVMFSHLILTQNGVHIAPLFGVRDPERFCDLYPHVVRWRNDLYLEDGHHRVVRTALAHRHYGMDMRVFDHPDRG